jgi:hypothetical protein
MKNTRRNWFTSLVTVAALALSGCALFTPGSPQADKERDVKNLCYAAGSIGTSVLLIEKPEARPAMELSYAQLDKLVRDGAVTGSLLRSVVNALPWKQLHEPTAVAVVNGLTTLMDATIGDALNIETQPMLVAAATGLRDGIKIGLGK